MNYPKQRPHAVVYPHAGGSASALLNFNQKLAAFYQMHPTELPGRGKRRLEPLITDLQHALKDLHASVPLTGQLILIGYSFGAYMAFVIAGLIRKEQPNRPICLVIMANEPIHQRRKYLEDISSTEAPQRLLNFAKTMGTLPQAILNDPKLLTQFIDRLYADLTLADAIPTSMAQPLENVPLLVVYGDTDPLMVQGAASWSSLTNARSKIISLQGGHFILEAHSDTIAHEIVAFVEYELGKESHQLNP